MIEVNRVTFLRAWRLVKPFFSSEVKWQARGLLLLVAVFALSIAGINVLLSYIARDFMTAFALKEKDEFFRKLVVYLIGFACATPVTVFYSYTEQRLALLWRLWLSRQMLNKYFGNLAYYKINTYEGIDNPDQRLEEDIRSFCQTSLSLFLIICNSILTLVLFIGILWSISINLIIGVLVYAFVGSVITYMIGRPLISLNFAQLKKEADYRYKLVNVRDNAESIAFYRGQKKELTRARQLLKKALENILRIINLNRNLGFFTTLYNNIKPVLPIVIVAPLYLSGNIEFGVVTQAADAFIRVLEALSVLIQHFGTISAVTAVVTRLGSFSEALDDVSQPPTTASDEIQVATAAEAIEFRGVTIFTPKRDQTLVRDLSFVLDSGGLLITGASGKGKSSILRVVSGLWNAGNGSVNRPDLSHCMFLPQRPYLVLGSLRNQLLYAMPNSGISDGRLIEVMQQVGLGNTLHRVNGLDSVANWSNLLSSGEQQQLAFARLALVKPKFAFLDEATTSIDAVNERRLYGLVSEMTTAFISVGYLATIGGYHSRILDLQGDGGWSLEERGVTTP